jgi:lantibiotic transport system ATP-binding protein
LKYLARDEGITILLSSHLLGEIEKLVTHIGIINSGSLLFQGTLAALNEKQKRSTVITFRTSNNQKALSVFEKTKVASRIEAQKIVTPLIEEKEIALINRQLVSEGIDVYEISRVKNDLEQIFFEVIKK